MNEQIWFTSVKYLWLSLNTSWILLFCIDTCVCTITNVTGINVEKRNTSAKQGMHKCSQMRKNKCGQMHIIYAY